MGVLGNMAPSVAPLSLSWGPSPLYHYQAREGLTHRLPVAFLVMNNSGLGMVRDGQQEPRCKAHTWKGLLQGPVVEIDSQAPWVYY